MASLSTPGLLAGPERRAVAPARRSWLAGPGGSFKVWGQPRLTCSDRGRTLHEVEATILIVDDYAPFRSSARLLLDGERFEVVGEAFDGASALDAVDRLRPDIVLLDVRLPDMDGFEVARRLAALPRAPAVVLVSSRDTADFPSRLTGSSARGFISKADLSPTRLADLLQVGS